MQLCVRRALSGPRSRVQGHSWQVVMMMTVIILIDNQRQSSCFYKNMVFDFKLRHLKIYSPIFRHHFKSELNPFLVLAFVPLSTNHRIYPTWEQTPSIFLQKCHKYGIVYLLHVETFSEVSLHQGERTCSKLRWQPPV